MKNKSQLQSLRTLKLAFKEEEKFLKTFAYAETLLKRGHFCRHIKEVAPARHD